MNYFDQSRPFATPESLRRVSLGQKNKFSGEVI